MTKIKGRIMPDGHPVCIVPPDPDKTAASNRTWLNPNTAARDTEPVHAPYERNENFDGRKPGRVRL